MRRYITMCLACLAVIVGSTSGLQRTPFAKAGSTQRDKLVASADVGGYALHYSCTGTGSPTVILEAGLGGTSADWSVVQAGVGLTRVCSYDRAGLGASGAGPPPRSSARMVRELHMLLVRAHISAPYVLVGHSLGGLNVQLYAYTYPREVTGLVLVDSLHADLSARMSPALRKAWFTSVQSGPAGAAADEAAAVALDFNQVHAARQVHGPHPFGHTPLVVLSHGIPFGAAPPVTDAQARELEAVWQKLQKDLVTLSANSIQLIAQQSGHGIPEDQPDLVIGAVRRVVDAGRQHSRLTQ